MDEVWDNGDAEVSSARQGRENFVVISTKYYRHYFMIYSVTISNILLDRFLSGCCCRSSVKFEG